MDSTQRDMTLRREGRPRWSVIRASAILRWSRRRSTTIVTDSEPGTTRFCTRDRRRGGGTEILLDEVGRVCGGRAYWHRLPTNQRARGKGIFCTTKLAGAEALCLFE